jgi:hypothetical protein
MELARGSTGGHLGASRSAHRFPCGSWRITCFGDRAEGARFLMQKGSRGPGVVDQASARDRPAIGNAQ